MDDNATGLVFFNPFLKSRPWRKKSAKYILLSNSVAVKINHFTTVNT